jgi:perosamine synthetase
MACPPRCNGFGVIVQVRLFKPKIRESAIAAAAEVMRSGWIGMGPKVAEFEKAFAAYLGITRALAVNTGTSALHLAVKLLHLPPGTEVITSPATFVGANQTLLYEHLTPAFADIDSSTGNLTPETVAAKITPRTGAIMLVHLAGYPCDLDAFAALAQKHNLPIIEDCAHACGSAFKGTPIGSSGNLCAFSFDPIKNLITGDGGMLICPTFTLDRRARTLRYMGLSRDAFSRICDQQTSLPWEYEVPEVGHRYHMNDIAAALGLAHLPFLDEDNQRRREIAHHYRESLAAVPGVRFPQYLPDRLSSYHLCFILAENRNALARKLLSHGVTVGVHYSRNDLYALFQKAALPNAEFFCSRALSLPLHIDLTAEEIAYVCRLIRDGW